MGKKDKENKSEKERLSMLISNKLKSEWLDFNEKNKIPTISKLVRTSVGFYIKNYSKLKSIEDIPEITHGLKEPLTSIKGFSEILMNDKKDELSLNTLLTIKEIYDQSLILEEKIEQLQSYYQDVENQYDLLIVDDDNVAIKLLTQYFETRGYKCSSTTRGLETISYLKRYQPKVILLDIILPDISGYDICQMIKSDPELKDLPIYYISAAVPLEIEKKAIETGADGFFLKPFEFNQFSIILDLLEGK